MTERKRELTCSCEDSSGAVCGGEMSWQEEEQDGVCDECASSVWAEVGLGRGDWTHPKNKLERGLA